MFQGMRIEPLLTRVLASSPPPSSSAGSSSCSSSSSAAKTSRTIGCVELQEITYKYVIIYVYIYEMCGPSLQTFLLPVKKKGAGGEKVLITLMESKHKENK